MASETAILAILVFTFLISFPSNLLAFYTFLMKLRRKPTPIDVLLLNLTLSDILLLLFLPLKMVEVSSRIAWRLPPSLCPLTSCYFYGSMYLSILFLTAISVDRYLGVAYPIKYKMHRRPVYALAACIMLWLLSGSHCSLIYIFRYGGSNESYPYFANSSRCYQKFSPEQLHVILNVRLELFFLLFFLPFIINLFCYVKIIRTLNSLACVQASKKRRAVGLAVATLLSFVICFGVYNISHVVGFIQQEDLPWRVEGSLLGTFNTFMDPFIFFFSSKAIRQTLGDCWHGLRHKLQEGVPCSKRSIDDDEGADAGQFSSSDLQSGHEGVDAQAKTILDQSAKTDTVRAEGMPQQAQCTAHQESSAPWL